MTEDDNGKAEVTAIDQTPDGRLCQAAVSDIATAWQR